MFNKVIRKKYVSSKDRKFVYVDLYRQHAYFFIKKSGKWKLDRDVVISSGKNATPTIRGVYRTKGSKWGFYFNDDITKQRGGYVKDATRISGGYYFHSITYNLDGSIQNSKLGIRQSHGCLRVSPENAKWIRNNYSKSVKVWIN